MRHLKIFMAILVAILTAPGARAADYTDANGLTYTYRENVPYTMGDLASVVSGYFLTKVPSGAVNVTIPSTVGGESVVGIVHHQDAHDAFVPDRHSSPNAEECRSAGVRGLGRLHALRHWLRGLLWVSEVIFYFAKAGSRWLY